MSPKYISNISTSITCPGIFLALVLSGCLGGQTTATEVSERLTNQEIAGVPLSQAADAGPKRRPEDPIYVNLARTVLDSKMCQAEKPKGAVGQHIRNEFASDPIIQLLPDPKNKIGRKASQSVLHSADIVVASKVYLKEGQGVGGEKLGKTSTVVFEATITSQSPPTSYLVVESGPVLQHMAVSKRFANQIRDIIVEKIGPEIPAR